jgi:penicillin amidase
VETCADLAGEALDEAADFLAGQYGPDVSAWRWGQAHQAYFGHAPFGAFPVLDGIFSARVAVPGARDTIKESAFSYSQTGFTSTHGPSFRAIYDLSDLGASRFAMPMGQSGHLASPHYKDLLEPWARGQYFQIRTDWPPDAPPGGAQTLLLTPDR